MLEEIVAALERHQGVADWSLLRQRSREVQLYLIGQEVESQREVVNEELDLEVFNDHPAPDGSAARGVASLKLVPADAGRIQERLDDAVLMASLVHNPPYSLAGPADYPQVPLADPELTTAAGATAAAGRFAAELWGLVGREPGVRLSAAELFLTYSEVQLRNSRGVRAESDRTRVMTELVLLAGSNGGAGRTEGALEAEHFRDIRCRRLADLRLPHAVAEAARAARDTLQAQAPRTRTGPVVLCGEALIPLFGAYTSQASAGTAYMKLSRFDVGQSVYGDHHPTGERLTLRANALRPFGLAGHRFSADGVPGQDVLLIEGGVLRARHATQRYAQYLGIPATGEPGDTEVRTGATALAGLLEGESVYQVVGFSAPDVDPITGDFGSEIRLGYEVTPQGTRPIKGGSVSGNVFEAFKEARFSRELLEQGEYAGPAGVRFESLRVSGDD
jgi:PmbA protein